MEDANSWAQYARVQEDTNWSVHSDRTEAAEETLNGILQRIQAGQPISAKQVDNLLINRSKTVRHRRFLLARNACLLNWSGSEEQRFAARLTLDKCFRTLDVRDQRMLQLVAAGFRYSEIAREEGVSEAAIKTRIHRARLKLKRFA